jgi:fructose-bisphosphate aldolase/6-deoxy-5-ketofructose 1-phosphate synthase
MKIPLSIPPEAEKKYLKNLQTLYQNHPSQRAFIFAADQRIEHLFDDFHGTQVAPEAASPEHIFKIASHAPISALATHFGPIDRYAAYYPEIPYIIKLNGKSNLIPATKSEPKSNAFYTVDQVVAQCSKINLIGVGYTIYLGSKHEATMLTEAAQMVLDAHQNGLVAILWVYLRGTLFDPAEHEYVGAGATGIAFSLGADLVKIAPPSSTQELALAVKNSGNTKVICAGGEQESTDLFLHTLQEQLTAGTAGCATGRNIFQRPEKEAIDLCKKIHALLYQ